MQRMKFSQPAAPYPGGRIRADSDRFYYMPRFGRSQDFPHADQHAPHFSEIPGFSYRLSALRRGIIREIRHGRG